MFGCDLWIFTCNNLWSSKEEIVEFKNTFVTEIEKTPTAKCKKLKLEMWANAQPDGRPAEYRWRPLFNAAKFGW